MRSTDTINPESQADCGDCPIAPDRRDFLRSAAAIAIGALGLSLPIRSATAKVLSSAIGKKSLSYPVPASDGADIDRDNEVILVRYQNEVYAFNLSCPHQNTALRWSADDHEFQCPKHKSHYRADGTFIEGRATRGMDRFAVRRDGDKVIVDLDKLYQQDKDAAEWKSAFIQV